MDTTDDPLSIVTGGSGGIGSEIVKILESRGDTVFSVTRHERGPSQINADLSSDSGCRHLADVLGNQKIDNLIFSHRYRGDNPQQDFNLSFNAVARAVNHLESHFSSQGSIVLLSSIAARHVLDEQDFMYHGTRAALEGLTRFLAVQLGPNGIRCDCILPTTLIKHSNKQFFTEDNPVRQLIEEITPLSRMGDAVDIANLAGFLCSSHSSFITGQSFIVDGGLSLVNQESIARRLTDLRHSS